MDAVQPDDLSQVVGLPLPVAGGGLTYAISGSEYVHPRTLSFTLITSAVAATRLVTVTIVHGSGLILATIPAPATQIASLTNVYTFGIGLTAQTLAASTAQIGQLPDLVLRYGDKITVAIANVDAGDTITAGSVVVDQVGWLATSGE